jgi:S-DNA-T family DNA segregation ATPase FtsK/SpoIIIE
MSKLGGDKKDDARRDPPKKDDGGKGPLGGIGKGLGGVTSRFGGGGDDKKPDNRPASSGSPLSSTSSSIGNRPPLGGTRPGSSTPPSSAPAPKGAPPKAGAKQSGGGGGIMGRVRNFSLFPPKQESKSAKAARGGKPVEVKTLSLSLDKKLELAGIGLVVVSIVLLLTSLSPTQGSFTAQINAKLAQIFGWGAIAIPIAMFPVGVWLIMLRAGQDTPVVDLTRVIGAVLLFVAALTLFQFIEAFSYDAAGYPSFQAYLDALRFPLLKLSSDFGRGGGMIGGEIYYFLLSNFGEIASFVVLVGWLIVAAMLTLSLSAQEIIAIFVSNYRNLRDVQQRRSMQRTAVRAEREATAAQIAVSKPAAGQLPGGASPALPAAVPQAAPAASTPATAATVEKPEERSIPITMGGRTVTASFRPGEPATVAPTGETENAIEAPVPVRLPPEPEPARPVPAAAEKKQEGGGLFGRIRSAAPVVGAAAVGAKVAADAVKDDDASKLDENGKDENKGRLGGGLFRRTESKPADDTTAKPAVASAAPAPSKTDEAAPEKSRFGNIGGGMFKRGDSKPADDISAKPAASAAPAKTDDAAPEKGRLGGLGGLGKGLGGVTSRFGSGQSADKPTSTDEAKPAEATPARTFGRPAERQPTSPLSPSATAQSTSPAASAAPSPEKASEEEPPARLGDLLKRPGTPEAPASSGTTPMRPNPFQRSTASSLPKTDDDDFDDEDEDEEGITERLSKTSEMRPASPLRPASPVKPIDDREEIEEEAYDDEELDDEEEGEDWSKLPPAQPKGTTPPSVPAPQRPSAASPLRPSPAPMPDLQSRMSALRSGQPLGAPPAKTDETAPEKIVSKPDAPAATLQETPRIERPAPRIVKMDEDEAKPAATAKTDEAAVPEKTAQMPLTPPARPASSAFGKPEPLEVAPTRLAPQPSQPTTGSGLSAPRPFSPAASSDAPPPPPPPARTAATLGGASAAQRADDASLDVTPPPPPRRPRKEWRLPDLNALLGAGTDQELNHDLLIERARIIEDTLSSFGAPGRVVEVRTGPVITQFGVEPDYVAARGKKNRVKVSAIAALDKDLQLALGAKSIRIEAPVPGKGYVGIEVPNEQAALVRLRDVMESNEFRKIESPLAIALGQGVDGTPVAGDLTAMPHLLIAGTTGSGKSVCVNSIIASLLIRNTPDKVKFVMVDPKRVELTGYNGVPHLIAPVVVELERIVSVLKWVTREMDERYRRFSNAAARNIEDFNKHLPSGEQFMPYIIVIIDELADLMMLAPDETERVITRIAALARATGIHLVIATQRPSVDVVTGLIKANFPARIAFAVAGSVDSRVILDQPGAERLLGRGDMLYMSGDSPAPVRLQGVFVSDSEINTMTRYWRDQLADEDLAAAGRPLLSQFMIDEAVNREPAGQQAKSWSPTQANRPAGGQAYWDREVTGQSATASFRSSDDDEDMGDGEDAMFDEAVELVRRLNKASVSLLQRRLRIGYTRAARLIDVMEERGIIGPATEGSKPRDVLPARD